MPDEKIKILIAEDEGMLRDLLRIVFEKEGYSPVVARDGQEALQIAHQCREGISLLVSDVQMPVMTGPDLARELRRSRPDLPVVLISAYPQGVLKFDTGWYFLQKPFLPKVIISGIYTPCIAKTVQGSARRMSGKVLFFEF
jgi:two-component system cell cycle sensor histidine kinase/response regulator CckA